MYIRLLGCRVVGNAAQMPLEIILTSPVTRCRMNREYPSSLITVNSWGTSPARRMYSACSLVGSVRSYIQLLLQIVDVGQSVVHCSSIATL